MINNDPWQNNKLAQRRGCVRHTALIAGAISLMFYTGFMLFGILSQ